MEDFDDSDEEYYFGIENHHTKAWLVKIPKFLQEKWSLVHEPGVELGRLRIYKQPNPNGNPKVTFHVPDELQQEGDIPIPRNYNLNITNLTPSNEFVFTENSIGRAVEITAKVEHEAAIGPIVDQDYRRIMQMRTQMAAAANSNRTTKVITDKQAKSKSMVATSGNQWDAPSRVKKAPVEKRERLPRNDLLDLLFSIFEEKSVYSFKELQEKTQQPGPWLKELLNEVCLLERGGVNNGLYQLKPEYIQKESKESVIE